MSFRRVAMGVVGLSFALPVLVPLTQALTSRPAAAPAMAAPSEEGGRLAMRPADGGEVSEAIAASFVRPMLKLPAGEPVDFSWARVDVDGDGYDELALSLRGGDRCGTDGCPFLLMRRKPDGSWKAVMATPTLTVSTRADPPRRSKVVVTQSSQGPREWRWDPEGVRMVPQDAASEPVRPASADSGR